MKYLIKLIIINIIFILLIGGYNLVYAVDRFVDIPVPPNSSGKADFRSEGGEKEAEQYEKNEITNNTIEEYIEKSGNNYLKNLSIDGYKLEPQFNMQEDEYIVYVPDRSKITSLNVIAEPDDIKATIEGVGNVSITEDTNIININVTAENGNLKVYTIKIENQTVNQLENLKDKGKSTYIIIVTTAIIAIVIVVGMIRKKKSKKS